MAFQNMPQSVIIACQRALPHGFGITTRAAGPGVGPLAGLPGFGVIIATPSQSSLTPRGRTGCGCRVPRESAARSGLPDLVAVLVADCEGAAVRGRDAERAGPPPVGRGVEDSVAGIAAAVAVDHQVAILGTHHMGRM